jgi:hypothetical protein
MSTMFQSASPTLQKLDPSKRVNYTFGLVLGVEEFLQSDTYFLAKHFVENRLLHGYGTVCGLDVTTPTAPQLEIQVTPGWAINPKGQEIHVPQLMCLPVNSWLQANLQELQTLYPGTAPTALDLCVVLCYRECKTDVVPIPGEPCQTQASSTAPSRIQDSFELQLCLNPYASPPATSPPGSPPSGVLDSGGLREFRPAQVEDDAVRAFVTLLSQIQVSSTGPYLTSSQLEELVLELIPGGVTLPLTSPPSGPPYYVAPQNLRESIRTAMRVWITEVRPALAASQNVGPCCAPQEKCVLLAEVTLSLDPAWGATGATVDQSQRPFLVPTRLLQEMAFDESQAGAAATSYQPVAAGVFTSTGAAKGPVFNNLTAKASATAGDFVLSFTGFQFTNTYIVKGTVQDSNVAAATRATVEFVALEEIGILIRVLDTGNKPLSANQGFMVEISQIVSSHGGAS